MKVDIFSDGDTVVRILPELEAIRLVIPLDISFITDITGEQKNYLNAFRGLFEIEFLVKLQNENNLLFPRVEDPQLKNLVIKNDNSGILDEIQVFTSEFNRLIKDY